MGAPLVPVVLCGGRGAGMWPLSRAARPKQLLALGGGERSLLQETLGWLDGLPATPPVVVCGAEVRFAVAEQLDEAGHGDATVLVEPEARGTAPAVAAAGCLAARQGDDAALLVLPSDLRLADPRALHRAIEAGLPLARAGWVVAFGVPPTRPEPRYGYLERGAPLGGGAVAVPRFVEKPDAPTAARLVTEGRHWWNAGIFLLSAATLDAALARLAPEVAAAARAGVDGLDVRHGFHRLAPAYARAPAGSLDRVLVERAERVAAVPLATAWRDVGAWDALWDDGDRDADGNAVLGDVLLYDVRRSHLRAGHRLVAAVGVEDLVVVETPDAVLVAARDRVDAVREVVARLRADARPEAEVHTVVERPWGTWELLDEREGERVKRLVVRPGGALSLQLHRERSEHWVVVRGTARVTVGDVTRTLGPGEAVDIPRGTPHRLENPGEVPVALVEVALGRSDEADIVRLEDRYGREGDPP